MPRGTILRIFIFAMVAICSTGAHAGPNADIVFRNGAVYTVNKAQPWASAVAVSDGRIAYVGDDEGAAKHTGEHTRLIDLEGRMLMPGFHDSHMHPMAAGGRLMRCDLNDLAWPDEVMQKIAECARELPEGKWLRAENLATEAFEGAGPEFGLLDSVLPDRPVFIRQFNGSIVWLNSPALSATGINAQTPDPPRGKIERVAETGEPTGVLRDSASTLAYQKLPVPDSEELREHLRLASAMANQFGITSSSEAQTYEHFVSAYLDAEAAGEMTLRVQASMYWDAKLGLEQLEKLAKQRDTANGQRFQADAIKLMLDGGVMDQSASMLEPYHGRPDDTGVSSYTDRLPAVVAAIDRQGFQVHMHALGDRAVRDGLDAIEYAIRINKPRERRHHMAHIALISPQDMPRFAALGVTADIQPLWAYQDEEWVREMAVLGPERAARSLPFKSLFDSGAFVVAGSDWISTSMNPLYGIQVAITRRPVDGSGPAWVPEQRVILEQMIRAYTINGAWLARLEHEIGSIQVGKAADLVVLERNLFETDPMALSEVKVMLTLLAGEAVYRDVSYSW